MPRQLWIDDHIEMRGDATHRSNMDGPWQPTDVNFIDDFTDDTLDTAAWTATVTNHTIAVDHGTYSGGWCKFTLAASHDNESCHLGGAVCWEDDQYAMFEARILVTDVSACYVYAGFSDEVEETSPDTPIDYMGGTLAAAATNAVGILMDGEDTVNGASSIVGVSIDTSLNTAVDSESDWADGEIHVLRIELDPDGDATYWLDGNCFGRTAVAVTSGTKLCPMIACAVRGTAEETVYVDYVWCSQKRDTV